MSAGPSNRSDARRPSFHRKRIGQPKQGFLSWPTVACGAFVNGGVEIKGGVSESLMGETMLLEVAPCWLEVVEFGGVSWQPLDGEPARSGGERGEG
jgi:hypothetical protein